MRKHISVAVAIMAVLVLFSATQDIAARETLRLNDQVRNLTFSKGVPDQLSYQGYLVDAADSSAVTGTLEMTFRLFDSETKGAELWSETHSMVAVTSGLFQVLLGSQTSFPAGLFDGSTLWLQMEVGDEVLTPRKPLVSVAYSQRTVNADHATTAEYATDSQHAVHADTADFCPGIAAWTIDGGNAYRLTGRVGIGTATPMFPLHVDGIAATKGLWLPGAFGPDTSYVGLEGNWIAFGHPGVSEDFLGYMGNTFYFMDSPMGADTIDANVVIGGKMGIGTDTPAYPLDVNGAVNATTYYGDGSNLTGIGGGADTDWTISGDTIYHEAGPVGIGTASPTAPLTIQGSSGDDVFFPGTSNNIDIKSTMSMRIGTNSGHGVGLITNNLYRVLVNGDGDVGIGTIVPEAKLHVHDDSGINAVYAKSADTTAIVGITGDSTGSGYGGYFEGHSGSGGGVYGFSDEGRGVYGVHTHSSHTGPAIYGRNYGSGAGVLGRSLKNQGVYGRSQYAEGVYAENMLKSIYAYMADTVWAGYFSGDVHVSGRVGIGTESPVSNLEVEDSNPDIRIDAGVGGGGYLRFSQDDDQKAYVRMNASGDLLLDTSAPGAAGITILNSNAHVGVGTESPARVLHVDDVMRLEPTSAPGSPSEGDMYMDSTTHTLMVYDGTIWQACW